MAIEIHANTPERLIAGSTPEILTAPCTVATGQNLAMSTIVESDANGEMIAHAGFVTDANTVPVDITRPVAGILVTAVDATAGATAGTVYTSGDFFSDKLVWPAGASTDLLKRKLLENSMIRTTIPDVGAL